MAVRMRDVGAGHVDFLSSPEGLIMLSLDMSSCIPSEGAVLGHKSKLMPLRLQASTKHWSRSRGGFSRLPTISSLYLLLLLSYPHTPRTCLFTTLTVYVQILLLMAQPRTHPRKPRLLLSRLELHAATMLHIPLLLQRRTN
ncbi:uncharacterized protein LY89DRAFT_783560 [Mollisia scopiformis]|uniref:Uncharacterized protein n=1 Tax=Mollisia scopiformis TaxID=149040 RepID=A0A194X5F9_MOLSC|nr:uncharacterized protein LY89DRAFT_783560 [Mollisia scopiformis]KUJ15406.1 hypothetical protein LY89DRAFT_783560 [Mollisia scopiformis]